MYSKFYQVAGITIEVRSERHITENTFHPKFRQFEVEGPGADNVLISHYFHSPNTPRADEMANQEIYHKDRWRIFKTDEYWIYQFRSLFPADPGHSAVGVFSADHKVVDIYAVDIGEEKYRNGLFNALTLFNSDQVLFSKLLCDRNGLMIHSNGFDMNGKGILLTGPSGVGKSTLSRMLKRHGFRILCDDRMFVTARGTDFWIHGNWCHGTVPDTSAGSVPLKAVLFLEQFAGNHIEDLIERRGVSHQLLRALVHPFLTPDGWEKTFDILAALVRQVKCFRVQFDLSGDICGKIKNKLTTDCANSRE
ncbi:MAG: hypothetical protein RBT11_08315 [Desulfobacterales bacterium]|jgi:hypothetical protein|nr:hypothetical protein [Desulfobacterales bacterium]